MRAAFAQKKYPLVALSGQELSDILVYLQNLPETRSLPRHFEFPASDQGERLFEEKGCGKCHTGAMAMERLLKNQTMTDITAAMWHHQPEMKQPPVTLSPGDPSCAPSSGWARGRRPCQTKTSLCRAIAATLSVRVARPHLAPSRRRL